MRTSSHWNLFLHILWSGESSYLSEFWDLVYVSLQKSPPSGKLGFLLGTSFQACVFLWIPGSLLRNVTFLVHLSQAGLQANCFLEKKAGHGHHSGPSL